MSIGVQSYPELYTNYNTEIQLNPLLVLVFVVNTISNKNSFIARKLVINHQLTELEKNFHGVVCGVTRSIKSQEDLGLMIHPSEIKNYLYNKKITPLVIDV